MILTGTRDQTIDQAVQYRIKTDSPPGTVVDNKVFAAMWKETAESFDAHVRRHRARRAFIRPRLLLRAKEK
jgi:hypothetical protein